MTDCVVHPNQMKDDKVKSFKQILLETRNLRALSSAELRDYLRLASSASSGGLHDRTPEQMRAARDVYSNASQSNPSGWYGKITRPVKDVDTLGEFGERPPAEESEFITTSRSEEPEIPDTLTPTGEVKMSIGHGFGIQEPSTPVQDLKSIMSLHNSIHPDALRSALSKRGITIDRYKRQIENIKSVLRGLKY